MELTPTSPKHTGHLPIHRVSHRGHLQALKILIPVTTCDAVYESGNEPPTLGSCWWSHTVSKGPAEGRL
ncbi:hypothetical protein J4Q44_G00100070 [Coregonus suidteri]|uniref:Uncharacterized protein n=1 Tax=Coregonus suidteri TaxID=861788 RepID=A0AAN8MNQ0_9TELE